jgi:exodeoxyribonuclease V beta subunit
VGRAGRTAEGAAHHLAAAGRAGHAAPLHPRPATAGRAAAAVGGERRLTNLLHLAELLQSASRQLDGEQALIRWLAEQIEGGEGAGDERVLRLESDAELVKVVTVHKSKGLEYPLVYLPFAVTARKVDKRNRSFFEFSDDDGVRQIDMALSDTALELVERARLQEDLRLMYVALTRARHFLWLGVTALSARKAGDNTLHESALGYLLTGGSPLPSELMMERWQHACQGCDAISLTTLAMERSRHAFEPRRRTPAVAGTLALQRAFRARLVGRQFQLAGAPHRPDGPSAPRPGAARRPQEELLEGGDLPAIVQPTRVEDAPWHRFPRGSVPGNFLHEQLEWLGQEGFAIAESEHFAAPGAPRGARRLGQPARGHAGVAARDGGHAAAASGGAAEPIASALPEMEFWFPSERLATGRSTAVRRAPAGRRVAPALPERALHGMLKGFATWCSNTKAATGCWTTNRMRWAAAMRPTTAGAGGGHGRAPLRHPGRDLYAGAAPAAAKPPGRGLRSGRTAGRRALPVPARDRQRADARLLPHGAGSGTAGWAG